MIARNRKKRVGSSFEAFLKTEGRYEKTQAVAIKRVLAWQIDKAQRES